MVRGFRVVFFGTPHFGVPTVDALLASQHPLVAVVTQPDRPSGRGQKTSHSPVKARAIQAGLPVLQPATLRDPGFMTALQDFQADIGVVAAYGKILPQAVIDTPRLGLINVHSSLLPRFRGAAPVHRAVIAGDRETGVTIMRIVKALDAGAMLATARRPIADDEASEEVERDLAKIGATLLVSTLDRMLEGPVTETPQVDADATYASRLAKEDGVIDWSRPARELHNLVRGLHPWPHAFSYLDGRRIIFLRTTALDEPSAAQPGTVATAHGDDLSVATGSGTLKILELQAEGGRRLGPREFLAGHPIPVGARFSNPSKPGPDA